jgi:hypothetical protein
MKYTKNSISLCVLCVFAVIILSCKKEQPALSKMDCSCAKEVSADFVIEEISAYGFNWEKRTETDTSYSNKNVAFRAKEENATYTWYIGTEKLNTKEIVRYFSDDWAGQNIPVTLVVKKKANTICFPKDDGYDSITKKIHFVKFNETDSLRIEGKYKVKSHLQDDSIIITVDYKEYLPSDFFFDIYNYQGDGKNCIASISNGDRHLNYRELIINKYESISNGNYLEGSIYLFGNNKVEINTTNGEYINGQYTPEYYKWKYKGRKL